MRAILTYHSIDRSGSPISCDPGAFVRHVEWMASGRIRVVPLEQLLTLPPSVDAVALTFDDAFANFAEIAAPRLREHGLPATLFVVADRAGSNNDWGGRPAPGIPQLPLLGWDALARLAEQGFELGAHTRRHPDLTTLAAAQLDDEVHGSAAAIERRTGKRPSTFAYPYGRVDLRASAAVSRVFAHACTTDFRLLDGGLDPVLLPRLDVYYFQRPGSFDAWGTSAFAARIAARRALRRLRGIGEQAAMTALGWRKAS